MMLEMNISTFAIAPALLVVFILFLMDEPEVEDALRFVDVLLLVAGDDVLCTDLLALVDRETV